jgi:twinkle protein
MESSKDGERKDIDKLLTKIRELINRTGVGFVCVSHLKNPPNGDRQWEDGRPVHRSDLRGSGSIGQLSDNILAIEGTLTDESTKDDRTIKLIKTRYGDIQEAYCDTFCYDIKTGKIRLKKEVM